MPSVKVTGKLDGLSPPGKSPGKTHGKLGRLGARTYKTHLVSCGHQLTDQLGPSNLKLMTTPKMGSPCHLLLDRLHQFRVGMTQKQCTMAHPVVNILIAVHIPLFRAVGPVDVWGKGSQMTPIMGKSTGKDLTSPFV